MCPGSRRANFGHKPEEKKKPMAYHALDVGPLDGHNDRLLASVRPSKWTNPKPVPRYNLVVIGAGTAGLVTAAGAAGLGARVAIVERDLMGGDCLNFGCVPSKALIAASRAAAAVRDANRFGIRVPEGANVDFAAVMERMRTIRAELSANDSAERFRGLGVDVFLGEARFAGADAIEVGDARLRFSRAVIASGARAGVPEIPGLAEAGFLTNETVFSLSAVPKRLAVIGAGPIGCELGQAFRRFGSEVTILEAADRILARDDRDAASRLEQALARDGVQLLKRCRIASVERRGAEKIIALEVHGESRELAVDEILIGAGRIPMVAGLALEKAGVDYDPRAGVKVNDYLQTTNPHIYAAGDVASPYKFTHIADATARIVIRNALFFGRARLSAVTVPWCTYTDPEIAHTGLSESEAAERGIETTTFVQEMAHVDRAVLDGESSGFVKVYARKGTDRIIGATIVASHAGEMISELTLAITNRIGLSKLADVIHPYPTQAEAIRKLGDAYNRTRLSPRVKRIFDRLLAWRR